jgi:ankyrin repeat protein
MLDDPNVDFCVQTCHIDSQHLGIHCLGPHMSTTDERWYELRNAIYLMNLPLAADLLRQQPTLLKLSNALGETVLHFLAVENHAEGVAWLHSQGSPIDTKNKFGIPVLFEVASLQNKELFTWFVKKGADLRATNSEGQDIVEHLLEFDDDAMAEWVRAVFEEVTTPAVTQG